jgi:hypothetical protein
MVNFMLYSTDQINIYEVCLKLPCSSDISTNKKNNLSPQWSVVSADVHAWNKKTQDHWHNDCIYKIHVWNTPLHVHIKFERAATTCWVWEEYEWVGADKQVKRK